MTLLRPALALAAFDLVQQRREECGLAAWEGRVHAVRAGMTAALGTLATDAREAVRAASAAAAPMLRASQRQALQAWTESRSDAAIRAALGALWDETVPLGDRIAAFVADLPDGAVASLLLAARSVDQAPTVTVRDTATAWILLTTPPGQPSVKLDLAERVVAAGDLARDLRALWARERGFGGDVLDVWAHLYVLGGGSEDNHVGWECAITPAEVVELVRESAPILPGSASTVAEVGRMVRERFFDPERTDDPLHAFDLDRYAYRVSPTGFCRTVETDTRHYVAVAMGQAAPHEVGRTSDSTWRIGAKDGYDRAAAEEHFTRYVRPRVLELLAHANDLIAGQPVAPPRAPKLAQGYRIVDSKTLLLFAAALDTDWTRRHLVSCVAADRLYALGWLVVRAENWPEKFADYLRAVRAIDEAVTSLAPDGDPGAHALSSWSYLDVHGRVLASLAEGAFPEVGGVADDGEAEADDEDAWGEAGAQPPEPPPSVHPLNLVLHGPPGTGKTWRARRLAVAIVTGEPC